MKLKEGLSYLSPTGSKGCQGKIYGAILYFLESTINFAINIYNNSKVIKYKKKNYVFQY